GGLAAAGDHIEVRRVVDVVLEVDHRDAERSDGCGGEVENAYTGVAQHLPVLGVCARGGGVEHQSDVVEIGHGEQSVDALRRGGHAKPFGPGQAVGCGVDADHRSHSQWSWAA